MALLESHFAKKPIISIQELVQGRSRLRGMQILFEDIEFFLDDLTQALTLMIPQHGLTLPDRRLGQREKPFQALRKRVLYIRRRQYRVDQPQLLGGSGVAGLPHYQQFEGLEVADQLRQQQTTAAFRHQPNRVKGNRKRASSWQSTRSQCNNSVVPIPTA